MAAGHKDALAALGVLSAIVAVWQFLEYTRDKEKAAEESKALRAQLTRIEKKIA